MRVVVKKESTADLLFNAEQLYDDLRRAGLYIAQACMHEVVKELRAKVREEA